MLFTVFQYLPILEEEAPSHKTEMAKKGKQNNLNGGDNDSSDDDSNDDNSEEDLNSLSATFYSAYTSAGESHFITGNNLYKYLLEQKFAPPPRV